VAKSESTVQDQASTGELKHNTTHCNTLQHTLQHTATHCNIKLCRVSSTHLYLSYRLSTFSPPNLIRTQSDYSFPNTLVPLLSSFDIPPPNLIRSQSDYSFRLVPTQKVNSPHVYYTNSIPPTPPHLIHSPSELLSALPTQKENSQHVYYPISFGHPPPNPTHSLSDYSFRLVPTLQYEFMKCVLLLLLSIFPS